MLADVISEVMQMERQQTLKMYTTKELLEELISREAVKLRQEDEVDLLDITA